MNDLNATVILRRHEAATICRETQGLDFPSLIPHLIDRGSIGMIVGPAKSKKSFLALNLAASISTGRPFLSLPPTPHSTKQADKVLYVNLELARHAVGKRLNEMESSYKGVTNSRNIAFISFSEFGGDEPLANPRTGEVRDEPFTNLSAAAIEWGATVIIVDPLYIVLGEENDNVLVTRVLRKFAKLRDDTRTTMILVHHTVKGRIDWNEPFSTGRGASSIGGFLEFVIGIAKTDNLECQSSALLVHGSRNLPTINPFRIVFDAESNTWRRLTEKKDLCKGLDNVLGEHQVMDADNFFALAKKAGLGTRTELLPLLQSTGLKWSRPGRGKKSQIVRIRA